MRLLFLGTAGSEGYPSYLCDCDNCCQARALGGRNHRLRSALLVNQDLLLDLGPDIVASTLRLGMGLSQVRTVLVTHRHEDHLDVANLKVRKPEQTATRLPRLKLFGPPDVVQVVVDGVGDLERVLLDVEAVQPFQEWEHGGYRFGCFLANHGEGKMQAQFYSVDDGGHRFLYACDTSDFPEATWRALAGQSFDRIILEETLGAGDRDGHMNFQRFRAHCGRFREEGMLRPGAKVYAQHISHMYNPVHDELVQTLDAADVVVAYDGLVVEI